MYHSREKEIKERANRPIEGVLPPSPLVVWTDWFDWIKKDIAMVLEQDPAARNRLEIFLSYPGLHAVWIHRLIHGLWKRGLTTLPRFLSFINRFITGIDIHPGAVLGMGVFLDHGMGCVIGETAVVGDYCLLYQGAVLGGTSLERKVRHPRLGARVTVGANASVLGAIHVGDAARIGSGSVVIQSVPSSTTVVGIPAKIAQKTGEKSLPLFATSGGLDHANLPDPIQTTLADLQLSIQKLETRIKDLEANQALETVKIEEKIKTGIDAKKEFI